MSRTKAIVGTELIPTEKISAPLNAMALTEKQYEVLIDAEKRAAAATIRIANLEKEERALKNKLEQSEEAQRMKKLKYEKRLMKQIQGEASAAYNGALEVVLAELPGKTLHEKIELARNNNQLRIANGSN